MALRWGECCKGCNGGQCVDEPSATSGLTLHGFKCPACGGSCERDGKPCQDCLGQGKLRLTSCPQKFVIAEARSVMMAADFARKGVLPFDRGWMENASVTMKAIQFVWMLEEPFRVRAGLKD